MIEQIFWWIVGITAPISLALHIRDLHREWKDAAEEAAELRRIAKDLKKKS